MKEYLTDKRAVFVVLTVIFLLCACGPSEEERIATETRVAADAFGTQTAKAPTLTPTPTSTPTPTPTPLPDPDPLALLKWEDLRLSSDFSAIPPEMLGVGKGQFAIHIKTDDGYEFHPEIENSFAFLSNDGVSMVFGYNFLLPTEKDRENFANISLGDPLSRLKDSLGSETVVEGESLDLAGIGDVSSGASAAFTRGDRTLRIDQGGMIIDDIGVYLIVRYEDGSDPPVALKRLASVYEKSINYPKDNCRLVSAAPLAGATSWPAYEIVAEGFYPQEGRLMILGGTTQVGDASLLSGRILSWLPNFEPIMNKVVEEGTKFDAFTINVEGSWHIADGQGWIIETIQFPVTEGENVVPPSKLELKILGYGSNCEIKETLDWPMASGFPATVGEKTPEQRIVFDDNLSGGWEDWSWDSTVILSTSGQAQAGTKAIRVSLEPNGAFSVRHNPFSVSSYHYFEFYIYVGEDTQRGISVYFQDDSDNILTYRNIAYYLPLNEYVADQWQLVRIPLMHLDASDKIITRLVFKDTEGTGQDVFYIDEIRFVGAVPAP